MPKLCLYLTNGSNMDLILPLCVVILLLSFINRKLHREHHSLLVDQRVYRLKKKQTKTYKKDFKGVTESVR